MLNTGCRMLNAKVRKRGECLDCRIRKDQRPLMNGSKAAECAALQRLRPVRAAAKFAPAFGVRRIPPLLHERPRQQVPFTSSMPVRPTSDSPRVVSCRDPLFLKQLFHSCGNLADVIKAAVADDAFPIQNVNCRPTVNVIEL